MVAASAFFAGTGAFGVALAVPSAGASPGAPAQITVPHSTTVLSTPRTTASVPGSSTTKPTRTTRPGGSTTNPVSTTLATGATTLPGSATTRFVPTTTTLPPTTTTIQGIGGRVPVAPATLPLRTAGTNGHVSPVFAWLSGIGFAIAILVAAARLVVTRGGGRDRAPLA